MRPLIAMLAALLIVLPVFALDTEPAFDDPVQQERYQRIIHQLRCLQCRSESIADSAVTLAADLRRQVREMMAAGKTDEEIFRYMTDRYGDYVLYKPPVNSRTWLLWAAPALFLAGGLAVVLVVVGRRARLASTDPATLEEEPDRP